MTIRVVLVDGDAAARQRFKALSEAQDDIEVIGAFGTDPGTARHVCDAEPDVAVVDLTRADRAGIEITRQIHDLCVDGSIVALCADPSPQFVDQALRAGAKGCLLKASAEGELTEAVRAVHDGRRYLGKGISTEALEQYTRRRGPVPPLERLTPRESQVLQYLVDGKTRNDIAVALGISPKSVDTYKQRMMLKLEIDNLPGLVKFAIRQRLTSL